MGLISKSTKTNNEYKNTTTSNPYAYSTTNNNGTIAGFQDKTALKSIYNFVNNSVDSLLEDYLKPNLNSVTNQAKIREFNNNLVNQTRSNLENDIINPLSRRNMIRSSQASDLYRNLVNQNVASTASYMNNLLANSQDNTAKILSNLLSYYMLGANYLTQMQNHSLNASSGGATKTTENNSQNNAGSMAEEILPALIAVLAS